MKHDRIAVIGGTGLSEVGEDSQVTEHAVETPFGLPSDPILEVSTPSGSFLFLARHGKGHRLMPSEVNYRANIFALKALGAAWCISVSSVGSLREEMKPGDIVFPDQTIDRTSDRESSFFGSGIVAHVSMAEPFCPILRHVLIEEASRLAPDLGYSIHPTGTYICISGPSFSSRAEAAMHRSWGADIIGMTNLPEAKLAREAELAYATIGLVTDYDCWRNDGHDVEASQILDLIQRNTSNARRVLAASLPRIQETSPSTLASHALDGAMFTDLGTAPTQTIEKLRPILSRVLAVRAISLPPR